MLERAKYKRQIHLYSYLSASMGLRRTACLAGHRPKTTPTITEKAVANITEDMEIFTAQPAKAPAAAAAQYLR